MKQYLTRHVIYTLPSRGERQLVNSITQVLDETALRQLIAETVLAGHAVSGGSTVLRYHDRVQSGTETVYLEGVITWEVA